MVGVDRNIGTAAFSDGQMLVLPESIQQYIVDIWRMPTITRHAKGTGRTCQWVSEYRGSRAVIRSMPDEPGEPSDQRAIRTGGPALR